MGEHRIAILGNFSKDGLRAVVENLRDEISRQAEVITVASAMEYQPDEEERPTLCIVFGGDGTLLSAARSVATWGTPLLGVNMGKLGFLAEFSVDHMCKHLKAVLEGSIQPTERMMLEIELRGDGESAKRVDYSGTAANDVAISAGEPFRMIDLCVMQGTEQIARYLGDGLIVCTPTGSTGYNLSAGGPILRPTLNSVVITPVAPHTLSLRPIVVGPRPPLRIVASRVNRGTTMIIDGQIPCALQEGQVLEVRQAKEPMRIIPHPGRPYFDMLAEKLHWGQSPHHGQR